LWLLPGTVGDAGRGSAIAVPKWACRQPAMRNGNATGGNAGELAEQAALKCLYLTTMSLDPTGRGRKRWSNRWRAALNAFEITFDGLLSAGRNLTTK
jgi:hypothetical protein